MNYVRLVRGTLRDEKNVVKAVRLDRPVGIFGMMATLKAMRAMVDEGSQHPLIRGYAIRWYGRTGNKLDDLKTLFNNVSKRIKYVHDVRGIETVQTPVFTLKYGGGDCDDLTVLFNAFAESIGFKTGFIAAGKGVGFSHVLSCVSVNGRDVPVDLAQRRFGSVNRKYNNKKIFYL